MTIYINLFISLCVSLYSLVSLMLFSRVAWLVLLFESVSDSNGRFGLSVRVKISTGSSHTFNIDNCVFNITKIKRDGTSKTRTVSELSKSSNKSDFYINERQS